MRTQIITLTTLLSFVAGAALAQTPAQAVQDVQQYNQDVRQLNTDIRNNRADVKKDEWDAAHDRRDIDRDDALRNADKAREVLGAEWVDAPGVRREFWKPPIVPHPDGRVFAGSSAGITETIPGKDESTKRARPVTHRCAATGSR